MSEVITLQFKDPSIQIAAELKELADAFNSLEGIEVTICDASEAPFWTIAYLEGSEAEIGNAITNHLAIWDADWTIDLSIVNGRAWGGDADLHVVQIRGEDKSPGWLLGVLQEKGLLPITTGGAA